MDSTKKIIENTKEARDDYGHAYGSEIVHLNSDDMKALKDGKCIAMDDSEYVTFIVLDEPQNKQT